MGGGSGGCALCLGSAVFLRAVSGPEGGFGPVICCGVFGGGTVVSAIRLGVSAEELGDKAFLFAIEAAYIG